MADDVNASVFPQYATGGRLATDASCYAQKRNPESFIYTEGTVHSKPKKIIEYGKTDKGVHFTYETEGCINALFHTHETPVFMPESSVPGISEIHIDIEIWSDSVFRVMYSTESKYRDPYDKLPEQARMLTGKPQNCSFEVVEENNEVIISTAAIDICVSTNDFYISAADKGGKPFFRHKKSDTFTADILNTSIAELNGEQAVFESILLESGEEIYGLGERFDGVARKGRQVDFWNKDAIGTTSPRTYINIPLYHSTNGYGLFLNSAAKTHWEIGTRDSAALSFCVLDNQMDYFVINGSPKEILKQYCELTGFAKLPPLWSFGLWMSRNSYTSWEIAEQVGDDMRKHDIPCDVLHLDTAWFQEDWNCDLRFSKDRFPDPEKHMQAFKDKGFHISLWQYNFIPPKENNQNYKEAREKGYTAKDLEGGVYRLPENWRGSWLDDVVIDFTNPDARDWYGSQIENLMQMGTGAIKTDFGEGIPEEAEYHSLDNRYIHNLYSLIYNYTIWKATKNITGEDIVWARSGTAGSQRFPIHWGGDSQCTFEALAGTLRGALSAGLSGIAFFSHDIGGFLGLPTPELYVRWAQLGMFSSHSRCHGAGDSTYREPWRFGTEAEEIFRMYTKLRYSLMPYIYEQALICTQTGLPMMRSLILEYPDDKNVYHIEDQFMFGGGLLIAPVLKPLAESTVRDIYLPAGVWTDYWTKEKISSRGEWISRKVDLKTMPIYVMKGTALKYIEVRPSLGDCIGDIEYVEVY